MVVDLLDPHPLSGKDVTEIDFAAAKANAATCGDSDVQSWKGYSRSVTPRYPDANLPMALAG